MQSGLKKLKESKNDRVLWIWILVAMLFPLGMSWMYFSYFLGHPLGKVLYGLTKVLQFVLPWWVWRTRGGLLSREGLGLCLGGVGQSGRSEGRPWRKDVWWGLASGAGIVVFGIVLAFATPLHEVLVDAGPLMRERVEAFGVWEHYLLFAVFVSLVNSSMEEFYWRGFLVGSMGKNLSKGSSEGRMVWWHHALAGVAFAAHHVLVCAQFFGWGVAVLLGALVMVGGMIWSIMMAHRRGLLAPWLSHVVVDVGMLALGWHFMSYG